MTRDEFLLRDFLLNWLFDAYEQGIYRSHATTSSLLGSSGSGR
jgi:hypothetical protein